MFDRESNEKKNQFSFRNCMYKLEMSKPTRTRPDATGRVGSGRVTIFFQKVGSGRVEKIQRSLMLVGLDNSGTTKYFLFREGIHSIDVVKYCNV